MARTRQIRDYGVIPERRHDAFLLALLLAVCLNAAFFIVQALVPRFASLMRMLAPEPVVVREEEEYPFVLVDPALFDDRETDQVAEAESNVTTVASQVEPAPEALPEERAFVEEGIDHLLTAPSGNPGEDISFQRMPGEVLLPEIGDSAEQPPEDMPEQPEESSEAFESPQPAEALFEPPPILELPERVEEVPLPSEPVESLLEPLPEEPDPPELFADLPEPPENVIESRPEPDPLEDMVDLAMLPVSPDGFFDPRTEDPLAEALRRQRSDRPHRQSLEEIRESRPVSPEASARPSREGRPQPTFKRIGGAASAGGAPPRRNDRSRIRLLDSDSTMRLLAHRYGEYMRKVAEQLQQSLNRVVTLTPLQYMRGNAKIRFGIGADGRLSYFETEYPHEGELVNVRLISEQMLREAAPFDPPTAEMLADPSFQRMSVTVFLE